MVIFVFYSSWIKLHFYGMLNLTSSSDNFRDPFILNKIAFFMVHRIWMSREIVLASLSTLLINCILSSHINWYLTVKWSFFILIADMTSSSLRYRFSAVFSCRRTNKNREGDQPAKIYSHEQMPLKIMTCMLEQYPDEIITLSSRFTGVWSW